MATPGLLGCAAGARAAVTADAATLLRCMPPKQLQPEAEEIR